MSVGLPSNSYQVCLETDKGGVRVARKGEGREDHSHQQERILNVLEEDREVMSKPVYWGSSESRKKKKWWSSKVDQSQVWWLERGHARSDIIISCDYTSGIYQMGDYKQWAL